MPRCTYALTVALLLGIGCSEALAAPAVVPVRGTVRALALGGSTVVAARMPPGGAIVVERYDGSARATALATDLRGDDDQVVLAASPQALAIGVEAENGSDYSPGRALAGPLGGSPREVALCETSLIVPPVAAAGATVAWRDGACAEPASGPNGLSPAAIVVSAVTGAAPRRIALPAGSLPVAIALGGDGGLVGVLRPSFFSVDSVVYRFGSRGLGEALATLPGRVVAPVGLLDDGTAVLSLFNPNGTPEGTGTQDCATALVTVAPGGGAPRPVALGGCPQVSDFPFSPIGARTAGARIAALVTDPRAPGDAPPLVSLVSVLGDGSDRRVHASGTYRPPLGMTADRDRVAWWQRTCADRTEIVVDAIAAAAGAANATCRASLLTRSARVRGGRASLRLRCRPGCSGTLYEGSSQLPRRLARFALARGTHTVRVRVPAAARRRGRMELLLEVEGGPARSAIVRLR